MEQEDESPLKRIATALERIAAAVASYADRDPLKMMEEALKTDAAPQNDMDADELIDIPESEAWRFE